MSKTAVPMAFASHKVALLPKIPYSGDAYPLFGKGDNFFYNTPPPRSFELSNLSLISLRLRTRYMPYILGPIKINTF